MPEYPGKYNQFPESELQNESLDRDVSPMVMLRGVCGKDGTGAWQYLQTDSSGNLVIDPTNLDTRYLKLDCSNSPLTGALAINPADGTADPLFQVLTDGTNQYGLEIDTYDLTGLGYGKYTYLHFLTNGAISNAAFMDSLLVVDINLAGSGIGQVLGFLNSTSLQSMIISAQWDWDGGGNNRMVFNDDILFDENLDVTGTLSAGTLSLANLSLGQNTQPRPTITFDALNNNGWIRYDDSSYGVPVRFEIISTDSIADIWIDRYISNYSNNLQQLGFTNSADEGIIYNDYKSTRVGVENPGFTAHYFKIVGTAIASDAWAMKIFHMANYGDIFKVNPYGSLEIGSVDNNADYDTYFKIHGKNNTATLTYDQSADTLLWDAPFSTIYIGTNTNKFLNVVSGNFNIDSDGGVRLNPGSQVFIGDGSAGVDYSLNFVGETNTGIINWMEDEDYFRFEDDILMNGTEKIYFNDTDAFIYNDGTNLIINSTTQFKFLSGATERFVIGSDGQLYIKNHINIPLDVNIYFGDSDVKILSDDDGYLDLKADTGIRVNNYIRHTSSNYRRYYHLPIDAFDPGASGATWTAPSANTTGGYQLDAAGEVLYFDTDVHADWDGASDMVVDIYFAINVDNTGGLVTDTVDLKLVAYYNTVGDTACKTQTQEVSTVVGQSVQYKVFKSKHTLNWDETDNVIEVGDKIGFALNLETDTSEVDDIIILHGEFYYNTTHVGIESGDT